MKEELEEKFPVGKLYTISFNRQTNNIFSILIKGKSKEFNCCETVFILLEITHKESSLLNLNVLLQNGDLGLIKYITEHELIEAKLC